MNIILREFFVNSTIIVAFITFSNHFFKDADLNPASPIHRKLLASIVSGILGCILMLYSIEVSPKIIIGFRYLPIIIMAIYASFADGLFAIFKKCKEGIDNFLKKPPKSIQISFFKDIGFGVA